MTVTGARAVIIGAVCSPMANVTGAELAAPEPFVTVTETEAGLVRSAAGTLAVKDVGET